MRMVVLKAGGNVIYPRESNHIDRDFLQSLGRFVELHLLQHYECVVLVPGGIGGELFIKWGRQEGCTEPELDEVGCALIDISALIISRALRSNLSDRGLVSPTVPKTLDSLSQALGKYKIIVAGCAIPHALTSDSLAASIAEHASADLKLVKGSKPFGGESSFYEDAACHTISLARLLAYHASLKEIEKAGHYPSLDYLCLRIIRRAKLPSTIVLKDSVVEWRPGVEVQEIAINHES
jgi:uridylate kinase